MSEIEIHQPSNTLTEQMEYAKAVSVANLLPAEYRGKPADIMVAVGLGSAMGLSPAESLYRIAVIKGKPTASAELVAANVRKAGHRLRVVTDEQAVSATCTIIRADDPDFEFVVGRDMAWAKQMGLSTNDNYRKQPLTMLANRAITACARLACPEALYGVAYTADEMGDMPSVSSAPSGGLAAALSQTSGAEPVHEGSEPGEPSAPEPLLLNPRSALAKAMFAAINEAGITEAERLPWISGVIGREVRSSKEMYEDDARRVLRALEDGDITEAEIVEDQP